MVCLAPAQRISAADALKHRYFHSDPAPTPKERLPRPRSLAAAAPTKDQNTPVPVAQTVTPVPVGMDSEDARFLKKRRMQMDAALEAAAG